ncbi:DNA-directed RNA polymerase subunit alpha, partial [Bacillus velezensis]
IKSEYDMMKVLNVVRKCVELLKGKLEDNGLGLRKDD